MRYFVPIFVALALTLTLNQLLFPMAAFPRGYDMNHSNWNTFTMHSLHRSLPEPVYSQDLKAFPLWGDRFGGTVLSGLVWDACYSNCTASGVPVSQFSFMSNPRTVAVCGWCVPAYAIAFSTFHSFWILATFTLFIFYQPEKSLFLMFGTFSGLMLNFCLSSGEWFLPFDYPSVFFCAWVMLLFLDNRFNAIVPVIIIGSLFKETVMCAAVLIPFMTSGKPYKGLRDFILCVGVGTVIRYVLMRKFGQPELTAEFCFLDNLKNLFRLQWSPWWLTNCGTVTLLWLLPFSRPLKLLAAILIGGEFLDGHWNEARGYFAVLPIGILALCYWYDRTTSRITTASA
jgi:hypothetical protein